MKRTAAAPPPPAWHTLTAAAATALLEVDAESGLSRAEVEKRAATHGANEIPEARRRGVWLMLLGQFSDFMIVVLLVAAIVSGFLGDREDTIAIVVIVLLNGLVGFAQEYRAERAVMALKQLAAASATVQRGGETMTIPAAQLVPGDIVRLEAGNVVPADLRLLEAARLQVDESALTGESVPVEKCTAPFTDIETSLGDRRNLAYKGTVVTNGRAGGVVVAIGLRTELGKIAALLQEDAGQKTPLQKRLAQFGQRLASAAIAVCALVFLIGTLRGEDVGRMFLTAISLAVAAIPEALPAVVTVALALGARTMVKKRALVRRLPAVETLGSVTYICSDKTGTLTENRMQLEILWADGRMEPPAPAPEGAPWRELLRALALNNDAVAAADGVQRGDPTEVALALAASAAGFDKAVEERTAPRVAELPFDSSRKCMTTFHRGPTGVVAYTKGAPEAVIGQCRNSLTADGPAALATPLLLEQAERLAADGLRVLAIAFRRWPEVPTTPTPEDAECDLTFLGLVGLLDPPRPEAAAAIALCRSAGIAPVMITGDHPATARCIAARLGIAGHDGGVLTGQELTRLSDEELAQSVEHVRVYARIAPEQKIRIVNALRHNGEFVAMTGDGVNDAPALRHADIGIAMGVAGTDVAREAAHMILLDDNFATIVTAVREGRRIFDNIRKFVRYAVTCNSAEIWTLLLAPLLGLPIPLLPIHILWINLVTDGLPGLALAAEPAEGDVMQRPPRPPRESLFAHGAWQHMIWVGLLMAGTALATQAWAYRSGSAQWQTMVFTVLALSQMGHALAIRSERDSLFFQGIGSNRPLLYTVLATTAVQLATIYVPFLNRVFATTPLSAGELTFALAASAVVFVAVEMEKWLVRRGWLYAPTPEVASAADTRQR